MNYKKCLKPKKRQNNWIVFVLSFFLSFFYCFSVNPHSKRKRKRNIEEIRETYISHHIPLISMNDDDDGDKDDAI